MPASHVGGDYFDYFQNPGAVAVDVVIADVSGHSVGAALIMTEVRSTLRAETRKTMTVPSGPAQVLRDLNELLCDDLTEAELFITMFYFSFLPETRTLKYANVPVTILRCCCDQAMTPARHWMRKAWCSVWCAPWISKNAASNCRSATSCCCIPTGSPKLKIRREISSVSIACAKRSERIERSRRKRLSDNCSMRCVAFAASSPPSDDIAMVVMQVS